MRATRFLATGSTLALLLIPALAAADGNDNSSSSRRNDWLFIQAEGGAAWANLATSQSHTLYGTTVLYPEQMQGWGYHLGGTAGIRLLRFITIGPRVSFTSIDSNCPAVTPPGEPVCVTNRSHFTIGTAAAELGLRIPLGGIEPYARIGFGYAWTSISDLNALGSGIPTPQGWTLSGGAGLDFWLGRFITLGAGVDAYLLNLSRDTSVSNAATLHLDQAGNAVGVQVAFHAQLGLHI